MKMHRHLIIIIIHSYKQCLFYFNFFFYLNFKTCSMLQEFEDGEILVESEPIRYELRDIKKDKWRTQITPNITILGTAILSNSDEGTNTIESIITYEFDKVIYWGTVDGVGRGLPTEVYEKTEPVKLPKGWGLKEVQHITEVWHIAQINIQIHNNRVQNDLSILANTKLMAISTTITINILTFFFFSSFHHCSFSVLSRCFNILWHPHANQCIQMKQVSASLQPGTAMNVTLVGNYTKSEGPYKAKLKSYYADSNETKTRDIEAVVSREI